MAFQPRPSQPVRRGARPEQVDVDAAAPFLPWPQFVAYLKAPQPNNPEHPRFKQGDHVGIIGPTEAGKTHIAFTFADIRHDFGGAVLTIACKPKDPLIDDAIKRGYWLNPGNKLEIPYTDGKPTHRRVIYWPRLSDKQASKLPDHALLAAEKALQRPAVGGALGYVRRKGKWCLMVDEGTWVCRDLNLQRDIDSTMFQFRTMESSVIILGQRPSWMGRYVLSSPTHLILFNTNDTNDKKALGDIGGVDTKLIQAIVSQLDFEKHEALYVNTRSREMFIVVAPPR